ncbi:MAG: hypothetical protein KF713_06050 [Turneriella sp.]|nr:hypothetical protein [Turneriella sp.]
MLRFGPICTAVLLSASLTGVGAAVENASDTKILRRIEVTGLKRTKPQVVLQYIDIKEGDPTDKIDTVELRNFLERLRIFSKVDVRLTETGGGPCVRECVLTVEVKEKWSLYPIPVYVKYRDTEIGGAFLVESNFLGENKGIATGALISNRGWQALLGYTDPHIGYSRISTTMRYLTGRVFIEDATPRGEILRSYTLIRHDFQSATGYNWRNGFFLGVLAGYRSAEVLDRPWIQSASVMNMGARLRYSSVTPVDFFQTGFETTFDTEKGIAFSGEDLHTVSSASTLHLKTFKNQFVSFLFSFQYSHYPEPLEQRLGGWQGTRTLPALLIPADKFTVGAINYQVGFLQFSWATFAALAFFDAGTARRDGETPITFYGPGAGLRLYLTEITIPALGIDVARDIPSEQIQVSFFIGYNLQ